MIDFSSASSQRIHTIDILRALTMTLMIFVNDLWSLTNIPSWLGHVEKGVDGMGLADTVFPAFLFIVGLSIPYSIAARRAKGENEIEILRHICYRAFALIVMGVFFVNGESLNAEATGMSRSAWNVLCCIFYIAIWNNYKNPEYNTLFAIGRMAGIVGLFVLAVLYKGGESSALYSFSKHWWGILGLIGWSYLAAAIITLISRNRFMVILIAWIIFALISMLHHAKMLPNVLSVIPSPIAGGTLTGLCLGGVLTSFIFQYFQSKQELKKLYSSLLIFAAILIVLTFITRPYWGIAKLGATPAWLFICSASTVIAFVTIHYITDVKNKSSWFAILLPAGTDTLLCYLIPYFAYGAKYFIGFHLPSFLVAGIPGLVKSFLFAILCIFITKGLNGLGIKLKI